MDGTNNHIHSQEFDMNYSFNDLPEEFKQKKNEISNLILKKLYSEDFFSFLYFKSNQNQNDDEEKAFLLDYFKKFKFITYQIDRISNEEKEIVNTTICIEGKCIIIEKISKNKIISILKETQSSLIDVASNCSTDLDGSLIRQHSWKLNINEEMTNFHKYFFPKHKNKNIFLRLTFAPIAAYIIGRNYYPSFYFNDKSFFSFDNYLNKNQNEDNVNEFNETQFIFLKNLGSNSDKLVNLMIHVDSFSLLVVNKVSKNNEKSIEHEKQFSTNFSHSCLTKFYGLINNENHQGFVYDFMSNGSLDQFLTNNIFNESINFLYSLIIMIRIFQAINYLHSNHLIHRDIKPKNILINHDFLPFLSDFENVRSFDTKEESPFMTCDIGSKLYSAPEQISDSHYSCQVDIYSFGQVIYYIFERKNMFQNKDIATITNMLKNNAVYPITNAPESIKKLCIKCLKYYPNDRPRLIEINEVLCKQIKTLSFFDSSIYQNKHTIINPFEIIILFISEIITFVSQKLNSSFFDGNFKGCLKFIVSQKRISGFLFSLGYYFYEQKDYSKARYFYKQSGKLGNSEAFIRLGKIFYFGNGVEQSYEKAKKYYEKSSEKNNPIGLVLLGNLYKNGLGVDKDYKKAIELYEKSAKLDFPEAFTALALMYLHGYGVDQDVSKTVYYLEKAIQKRNAYAMIYLANLYLNGYFIEQDYQKAKHYYEEAAKLHETEALIGLGKIYLNGFGVIKNVSKAIEYFERAASQKNSNGFHFLGVIYYLGDHVEADYIKAKAYFEKAANLNNPNSDIYLGILYFNALGVKRDYNLAKKHFERSITLSNSNGYIHIGNMYFNGNGVERDFQKAKEYYELSISKNNANGYNGLGFLYLRGYGVNQDYSKAEECFTLAAKNGNRDANVYLGNLYYVKGFGLNKNKQGYNTAKRYYQEANKTPNQKSLYRIGLIYEEGIDEVQDYLLAITNYELSVKKGNSYALIRLGNLYLNGHGVEKNCQKAIEYYEMSAQRDNSEAYNLLGKIYCKGLIVPKNYAKAKGYFEKSVEKNDSDGYFYLGKLYFRGYGVENNYNEAIKNFEISASNNNSKSLFYLGYIYENGIGIEKSFDKAIENYKKCTEIYQEVFISYDEFGWNEKIRLNSHHYTSCNNLGLLYLFEKNDVELAESFLNKVAYTECPYFKNNYGLLYKYRLDSTKDAKKMFEQNSNHKFSLTEFNIAHIYEEENKEMESINHYINAVMYENEKLKLYDKCIHDERLDISKIFIIHFTNLKLFKYYFNENEEYALKYLIGAIFKPLFKLVFASTKHSFAFHLSRSEIDFQDFILLYPLFDLKHQKDQDNHLLNSWEKINSKENIKEIILLDEMTSHDNNDNKMFDMQKHETNELMNEIKKIFNFYNVDQNYKITGDFIENNYRILQIKSNDDDIIRYLKFPLKLYEIFLTMIKEKTNKIDETIEELYSIIFSEPYSILFGRIRINFNATKKVIETPTQSLNSINELFYQSFDIKND